MTNFPDQPISGNPGIATTEARLKALIEATSDAVYSLSPDCRIMRELDGRGFLKDVKVPSTSWRSDNVHPDDRELIDAKIEECIREKKYSSWNIALYGQTAHRAGRFPGLSLFLMKRAIS